MKIGFLIFRGIGMFRFYLISFFKRKKLSYKGLKHFAGRGAKLKVNDGGKISIGRSIYLSDGSILGAHLNGHLLIGNNNFFNTNTCPCISSDKCGAATLIKNNFNGLVVNIAEEYNNHFEKVVEFIRKLDKEKREVVQQKANEYKEILAWKSVAKKYAELE